MTPPAGLAVPAEESEARERLAPAMRRAEAAWRRLGWRLRTITPSTLARAGLVLAALAGTGWVLWNARVALLPFVLGGIIAYTVLPIVNALDRVLPRPLASLLVMLGALAFVGALVAATAPLLLDQAAQLIGNLPSQEDLQALAQQLQARAAELPPPAQEALNEVVQQISSSVRQNLSGGLVGLGNFGLASLLGLANSIGFLLGFIVIPTWVLSALNDHRRAAPSIDRVLPSWMRADFWAVLRILDRSLGAFFRGQLVIAFAYGLGVFLGLTLLEWLGVPGIRYKVILAAFAGLMRLVPFFGILLGAIPPVLVGLAFAPLTALATALLFLALPRAVDLVVGDRIARRVVDIHPVVLAVVIVALSQLSIWWLILAAPMIAVFRDLFRYVYGRLEDPPRPAGQLPSGLAVIPFSGGAAPPTPAPAAPPTPVAYRHGPAQRPRNEQG
jgi:predicted PurR-regulated permease PerM